MVKNKDMQFFMENLKMNRKRGNFQQIPAKNLKFEED